MQQDHKISSMVSLISSLTEEEEPVKPITTTTTNNTVGGNITIDINSSKNRIQVSDDESDSDSGESIVENDSDLEYSTTSSSCDEILSEIDIEVCDDDDKCNIISSINLEEESADELITEQRQEHLDTRSIHLEPTDFSIFKTISVVGEIIADSDDATNYKKMTLPKLREIAQSLGHEDTSKLKKQELLKLLGVE